VAGPRGPVLPYRSDFQGGTLSGACAVGGIGGHRLRQAGGSAACPAGPGRRWDNEMQQDSAGLDGT